MVLDVAECVTYLLGIDPSTFVHGGFIVLLLKNLFECLHFEVIHGLAL
jgi:hypothetical protein